jgi:hypothetical protein
MNTRIAMPRIELPFALPTPPGRARLRAFWLVLSLAVGLALWAVPLLSGAPTDASGTLALIGATIGFASIGLAHPYAAAVPYRAWNWMVHRFSIVAIRYVTAVAFWTVGLVFASDNRPGRFEYRIQSDTGWRTRTCQSLSAYKSQHTTAVSQGSLGAPDQETSPVTTMRLPLIWAFAPFMTLIRALHVDRDPSKERSAHIYTLY